jgi:thiamine-phosphate pyrophosphorylase
LLLYYITDRRQLSDNEGDSRQLVLKSIQRAAEAGVDFIQLRERDLPGRALFELATAAVEIVNQVNASRAAQTRLLINSRIDVALASGAAGVHLRADDISAADARSVMLAAGQRGPMIAVSCHSMREVELAEGQGADFAVFGPVFEKAGSPAPGVRALEQVCQSRRAVNPRMPVLAIGGVDLQNAAACLAAGADGIAGIRLFQREDVGEILQKLDPFRAQRGNPTPLMQHGEG